MSVKEMHYDFLLKYDKVASNQRRNYTPVEIDWFLNEAQNVFKKQRLFGNNSKQTGFEETQKRIDDLAVFHVKYPAQPKSTVIKHDDVDGIKLYELRLNSLKYEYEYFIKGFVTVLKNNCKIKAKMILIQNDDFEENIKSAFGLDEENVFINFGKSTQDNGLNDLKSIYIYSKYDIDESSVMIEYIKSHVRINYEPYVYLDNLSYPATDSQFAKTTHTEIVDIAVMLATGITDNPQYNVAKEKLLVNE
jgi:hypothetical protein